MRNSRISWLVVIGILLAIIPPGHGASFGDLFRKAVGSTNSSPGIAALGEDQVVQGLKEALAKGTTSAVAYLGRTNGFLTNVNVRIPMPEKLAKIEKTLRALKQEQMADDFVTTMNRAAEQAVPAAASILGEAVKQMTLADAKGILAGSTNAATLYFRRTSETNLYAKFLPIVQQATAQTGVTASYKQMVDRTSGGLFSNFVKTQAPDLDGYVTQKALDGLFVMVADEERRIRENPAARTTEILQKVFGAIKK
jgi:hypothetical protein